MDVLDRRRPRPRRSLHLLSGRRHRRESRPDLLGLVRMLIAQWRAEWRLRRRDAGFRTTNAQRALRSYAGMSEREFESVNGPQEWANWRTIPRVMAHAPDRPLTIVDLGCGSGGSTMILARHAPPGSSIRAYDVAPGLLESARRREYLDRTGAAVPVQLRCQSITDTLRDEDGEPLADASVDLAHASGVVGHHLDVRSAERLVDELQRVVGPGGITVLDAGPRLDQHELRRIQGRRGFVPLASTRLLPFNTRVAVVCRRSEREPARPR